MSKRKASLSLTAEEPTARVTKRPKLAKIVTQFEYVHAPVVVAQNDSDPSPLNWPFDDEDEDDLESLFASSGKEIDHDNWIEHDDDSASDYDSLFDDTDAVDTSDDPNLPVAVRRVPPVPGLHFDPSVLLPEDLSLAVAEKLQKTYFSSSLATNQIMLFTRPSDSLPAPLDKLLSAVEALLSPVLSREVHDVLFAPRSEGSTRQAIINRYAPGEGISPHVDLLRRYGDGVVGVSLGAGCAMGFAPVSEGSGDATELYLPPRSVIALEGDARYKWTHGIPARTFDLVESLDGCAPELVERGTRISVTFRWMLPGAHVVGPSSP